MPDILQQTVSLSQQRVNIFPTKMEEFSAISPHIFPAINPVNNPGGYSNIGCKVNSVPDNARSLSSLLVVKNSKTNNIDMRDLNVDLNKESVCCMTQENAAKPNLATKPNIIINSGYIYSKYDEALIDLGSDTSNSSNI